MIKFPLIVIYAVVAFNITAFAALLQLDVLIYHALSAKLVAWTLAMAAWTLTFVFRNKFLTFRYDKK